ncbi:manganese efflux pump MntP [Henriciella pelagia]|jgi:manganese efflux pump family protein|uniref:Putative manganese efflux pump MntP n=1 Tax=Henriciella pelagia TaxID=1977912 RepID=A0ABQ1JJN1_9PROT|nr:manganese efflux pump MntP family protein [Henriciella pelagia]GGB70004.1 putative manganese efflux pump MntP [Henriciella pelagia]
MTGLITLFALALSLSVDAFAASLGKGAAERKIGLLDAARIGAVFGGMEAVMPLIGYTIGIALASWVAGVDHWIAFVLLSAVGLHMIWEALSGNIEADFDDATNSVAPGMARKGPKWLHLVLAAFATSIDALVVGVSLAMMDVNIIVAVVIIGCVTAVMATMGVLIGRKAGERLGHWAEVVGGVVLIAIGSLILWQHLTAAG